MLVENEITLDADIFDDLFHGCAFTAYLEQAAVTQAAPSFEKTRRRAFELFEAALREENGYR